MQSSKQLLNCSSEMWKNIISLTCLRFQTRLSGTVCTTQDVSLGCYLQMHICRTCLHHTGGKQSFTYLLDIRQQQRDHSVCYLLCSSKSWHNGGSIKHKENSQLSWVAGTLWKDLDHRKKSVVQTSGQVEMHIWLPSNHQDLRTLAYKIQQFLLAQLN